jgi:hypothetical protein
VLSRPVAFIRTTPLGTAAACVFLVAAVWVVFNTRRWNHREILQWDTDGYYLYLPAALIHGDPLHLDFLDSIQPGTFPADYRFGQGAFFVENTGRYSDKYTMGTAVFELPFVLTAHAWCSMISPGEADGYSPPYHLAVALASAFWPWLGLLALLRFLRRQVSDAHAAIALLALGLGTNLFFYSSFAGGMSHPFLFFLCAMLIERTDRWYTSPSMRTALAIGACLGLATLARPTCAFFALVPLCWRLREGGPRPLRAHVSHVIATAAVAFCCVVPQLVYWKVTTGSFLFYSYGGETFDLAHPQVLHGLFSFRKGWFVYTPLALVAVLGIRLLQAESRTRPYRLMLFCFFLPFLYITFSWDPWWYGGGFGSRPMIDTLPLLALPLAMLVRGAFARNALARGAFIFLLAGCVTLNLFQQWQYQRGIINCCEMTMERWWQVFGEPTSIGLPPFP